ncbi:MAG: hypothetical protein GY765_38455, partial [bacterium]|nr:hypothetical protein [bacterium]
MLWALVVALFFGFHLTARSENIRFRHINVDHGLTTNTVFCIFQDSRGFMWFGTEDGLNRYDGYDFNIYRSDAGNPATLSHNYIQVIYESPVSPDILWVGTTEGLNKFNRNDEVFTRYL